MTDSPRSHSILLLGNLEPAEFGAILPSPLSHILVEIVRCILKSNSIVLAKEHASVFAILLNDW